MNLKDKIMIERLSRLEELQPAEQEEVLRDPALKQALVENRLLGGLAADAPPPPNLEPTLEMALSRPKSREDKSMSVQAIFASLNTNRIVQAGAAAVLIAVMAVAAFYWIGSQNQAGVFSGPAGGLGTDRAGGIYVLQSNAEEQSPGVFTARCRIPGIQAVSSDGRDARLSIAFEITSSLSARDAAAYEKAQRRYEEELAEYNRKLEQGGKTSARAPAGLVLARASVGGEGGGRMVAQPTPPQKPQVPATVLARAFMDNSEEVVAAVVELAGGFPAGQLNTPEFCARVKLAVSPMFDTALGSIDAVEVESVRF